MTVVLAGIALALVVAAKVAYRAGLRARQATSECQAADKAFYDGYRFGWKMRTRHAQSRHAGAARFPILVFAPPRAGSPVDEAEQITRDSAGPGKEQP